VIVVADATPLLYLILIEHAHILPSLYGRLMQPSSVALFRSTGLNIIDNSPI
jgi:hypothetical protein